MSMFEYPGEEDRLCQVLKAYVQEWGPEHVIVSVPAHWDGYMGHSLGRVRLEFSTTNLISIEVVCGVARVRYDAQLKLEGRQH